jgi:subtilisin family serine protease
MNLTKSISLLKGQINVGKNLLIQYLNMKLVITILGFLSLSLMLVNGQEATIEALDKKMLNWQNKDIKINKIPGTSVEKAYRTLLSELEVKDTVIVAVIDGGVDIRHEELSGKIWNNPGEIPGNLTDDDENGYVDDVYGWNFIGSSSGENISYENYEVTRILKSYNDTTELFLKARQFYDEKVVEYKSDSVTIQTFEDVYNQAKNIIRETTGIEVKNAEDLKKVKSADKSVAASKKFLKFRYSKGFSEKLLEQIKENNIQSSLYYLNQNFNPRAVIGDNPEDLSDRNYGNNNVTGPNADHGTGVAGVIASRRDDNKGIDGIASAVKIMPLRVVPDGDERDKDIALAIMYAVDNGARIINMSFGKKLSPQKEFVDSAVKYAERHNVLLVHSSGNDGEDLEIIESFPSDRYIDGIEAKNLISVGASSMKRNKELAANFTNYGKKRVDIFAPGVSIAVPDTGNTYDIVDGASFSSPVVSGIAAVILSYYPELTPEQIIDVLIKGSVKFNKLVVKPGDDTGKILVPFSDLSRSGGVVNLYNSLILAGQIAKTN